MSRKGKSTVGGLEESDGEDSNEEEMSCSQESVSSQKSLVREISRAALSSPPKKSRLNDDVPKNRPSVKQHESKFSGESIRGKRRQNCLNPAKVPSLTEDPFGSAFPEIQLTTATSLPSTEAEIDISASDALPQMQSSLSESSVLTRKIFTEPKKRAAYRHVWSNPEDSSESTGESPKNSNGPALFSRPTISQKSAVSTKPTKLTRTIRQPTKYHEEAYSSLRCDRKSKEDYTIVKQVKQAHQCHESGEVEEFSNDLEYILDSLKSYGPSGKNENVKLLCKSVQILAEKCLTQAFRNYIKATGAVVKIFSFLTAAPHNLELAYRTASVIYILSRDRLGLSVDRKTLKLIIDLMKMDNKKTEKDLIANEEFRKRKEEVWHTLDQWRSITQLNSPDKLMFEVTAANMTPSLLATESLAFITMRKLEDWFKRELRDLGGLDLVVQMVASLTGRLVTQSGIESHDDLKMLERLLKILEQATFMNAPNQVYLIPLNDYNLLESCVKILSFCQKSLSQLSEQSVPALSPDKEKLSVKLSAAHFDCLTGALKVLCNLTHDNELSCSKLGQQQEFFSSCLSCIVSRPHITESQRFDMLVLGLGLMINSVEHCSANRRCILSTNLVCNFDSNKSSTREMSAVEALTRVFLLHEAAARELDEDTDETIKSESQSVGSTKAEQDSTQELQDTVRDALQKAGKHMENSIAASYAALLIGCVIQFDDEQAEFVKSLMPSKNLKPMIEMVAKILEFMELTSFAGNTGSKAMAKILEALENLD